MLKRKATASSSKGPGGGAPAPAAAKAADGDKKDGEKRPKLSYEAKVALFNDMQAKSCSGTSVVSLLEFAKLGAVPSIIGHPETKAPCFSLKVGTAEKVRVPDAGRPSEIRIQGVVVPAGFVLFDPIDAILRNEMDGEYKKGNPGELSATFNVAGSKLFDPDPENPYKASQKAWNLLCCLCSDALCSPSATGNIFDADVEKLKTKAKASGAKPEAVKKFIEAAIGAVNRNSWPYLPCKATDAVAEVGADGDWVKAALVERQERCSDPDDQQRFKLSTRFFPTNYKKAPGSGPDEASMKLAEQLGGEDWQKAVEVLKMPENHNKKMELVKVYDEHNVLVPPEKYRATVAELKGGAVSLKLCLRMTWKKQGQANRAHVAAYIDSVNIVKRGETSSQAPSGVGFADM